MIDAFSHGTWIRGASGVQTDAFAPGSGYGAILADPPWQFSVRSPKGAGRLPDGVVEKADGRTAPRHYETMSLADICALPVGAVAGPDAALFMWVLDSMLPQALQVGAAWGFSYKTVAFTWAKSRVALEPGMLAAERASAAFPMGPGYWTRSNPEQCLLFTRGAPKRRSCSVRQLIVAPRREHSRKPAQTHVSIEALVRGPYLELFARHARPGWDAWGLQTDKFEAA
jgi:N6-adenosine-specific RNA methylase IME4